MVIRLSAMGDVAMTVPVIKRLVAVNPDIRITLLSRAFFKPFFKDIPQVTFYAADVKGKHKGIVGLYKLFKELMATKPDAVADLHNVLRSNILKVFFKWKGLKVVQIDKGRAEKKALTRMSDKVFKPLKTTHERYAEVFQQLSLNLETPKKKGPQAETMDPQVIELLGDKTKKWLGIAPFAAFEGKMYPLDLMEKVVKILNDTNRYKTILFGGGPSEVKKLDALSASFSNVTSVAGKLNLEQELALISNLDLMVAMDSGNAHLAAMKGIEVITLWGVTHPYAGFYPYGQDTENALLADREKYPLIPTSVYGNKIPEGYEDAMRTITPEAVVKKITEILN